MNESPLVSIIIPVYMVEKYLHQCIDSVINQTYENLEIILVDDGSTDRSPEICDEYAKKDIRIKVIHQPNVGLGATRNVALDIACGKYLAFVDSDDYVDENWINCVVELLEKNNFDAVIYEANIVDANDSFKEIRFHVYDEPTRETAFKVFEKIITDKIGSQVWKAIYRREAWQGVRFPVGRLYEDMPTVYKVYANMVNDVIFLPKPLYYYRMNDKGISLSKDNNDRRAYHIFLGFLDMYTAAKDQAGEQIKNVCLANAAIAARGILGLISKDVSYNSHCRQFLKNERAAIFSSQYIPKKEKCKMFFDIYLPSVSKLIRRIKAVGVL